MTRILGEGIHLHSEPLCRKQLLPTGFQGEGIARRYWQGMC